MELDHIHSELEGEEGSELHCALAESASGRASGASGDSDVQLQVEPVHSSPREDIQEVLQLHDHNEEMAWLLNEDPPLYYNDEPMIDLESNFDPDLHGAQVVSPGRHWHTEPGMGSVEFYHPGPHGDTGPYLYTEQSGSMT